MVADTKEYDWSKVTARAAKTLRAPKIPPVPDPIVALAQQSYDGVEIEVDGEKVITHVLNYDFGPENVERAGDFAKHMRNAGHHTKPPTTVRVAVDPDNEGKDYVVSWQAGSRRGRKAS